MRAAINALAGLIFGLGLLISGMANPAKVQNFLDPAGSFDPSFEKYIRYRKLRRLGAFKSESSRRQGL